MKQVISGPLGSGKTSALKEKYRHLIAGGVKSDNILVMVRSSLDEDKWRKTLKIPVSGTLHIHTYFGLVQNQLTKFWPLVESKLPGTSKLLQPVFMTVEASHYLISTMVEEVRHSGGFAEVKSTTENIAIQLIDNLNQAAVNGISLPAAAKRLHMLAVSSGGEEKTAAYLDAITVMKQFREKCLQTRSIDYSLAVELFNGILMSDCRFLKYLKEQWRYIIVDDIEEMVPTAQDLILYLLNDAAGAYMGYDPEGGHTVFFGAYPEGVRQKILPRCEIKELKPAGGEQTRELAANLVRVITGKAREMTGSPALKGQIVTVLRGEMLEKVVGQVERLIASGTKPKEIAVIAPVVDKVLEFSLHNKLAEREIGIANLSRSKRLLDQPFANAMITLAVLANPDWKTEINFSSLVQTLCLLLKTDPVRASLLAEETFKNDLKLPDLDELNLREQVGYRYAEHYQELRQWVERRRQDKPDLELLFQQAFAELLSPLLPGEEDLLACRQMIDSAVKLRRVLSCYNDAPLGHNFIDMIQKGTLAAEVLYRPPAHRNKVILTSPLNFILNPYIERVKYQFWLDIGGNQWMRGMAKELANPWVLSRRWTGHQVWDDGVDQNIRRQKLGILVRALLGKCSEGIFVAYSEINSQGWEQNGLLVDVFDSVQQGREAGD
ncbi:hypothetical protein JOC37_001480 [Desulfohalotomaculum tongense]|uniref:UvrD-helicase domain-containing protein n=1 Tax=Desulforadius tongensis TaxID=1216062 RepID=UPI0019577417|nr:UvrD-helicase domain-containing protein [Desulforadius tongensis]MBM7855095.1 hypothetical protein [Desulforadius tongensis]